MNRVIALLAVLGSTFIFGCGRDEIKMMDSPPCMVPPCTFDAVNDPHTKLPEETKTELTIDYSVWQPPSRILVAGGDVWHNIVQYKACAKGDKGVQILRLNALTNAGYNFWAVGVAQNGAVRGITVINGTNGDIDLLAKPIPVPAGNCINFELWGKLANVQSSSSVAGSKQAPRSGNVISLGINAGLVNGRWDVAYTNHLNVEAYDTTSGARVLVEGKPLLSDKLPFSFMVMRKSKPYINRIPALNPPLEGGKEATLYTHQVSADTFGGAVSVKRMTYAVSI
ncbi:hypothetical protein FJZ48_03240, partial [Candidatus Uhrbacteria bacterium]|nr:hypothetical protein [Candidatus Uhrbacteria bacterium]